MLRRHLDDDLRTFAGKLDAQHAAMGFRALAHCRQPPAAAAEPRGAQNSAGPFEFHTEKWESAYIRRIDATIMGLKSAAVPVFWVGLPAQRNSRASSDSAYLNELYRQQAEKAGIAYIDIWDGFVDDAGRFSIR